MPYSFKEYTFTLCSPGSPLLYSEEKNEIKRPLSNYLSHLASGQCSKNVSTLQSIRTLNDSLMYEICSRNLLYIYEGANSIFCLLQSLYHTQHWNPKCAFKQQYWHKKLKYPWVNYFPKPHFLVHFYFPTSHAGVRA